MSTVSSARHGDTQAVVAIPARDEADWIGRCLFALDRQQGASPSRVIVLVNNSTDRTTSIIQDMRAGFTVPVEIVEHQFAEAQRTAGQARRMAMDRAVNAMTPGGVVLCTDADGQVAPDWLAANLFHIRQGADAVAGCAVIDPVDAAAIPALLHENDARECAYAALLDEIDSLLDPDPADPWPRHTEHSGASIAATLDAFCRAGGIPPHAVGEDRAFFAALRRVDARIRHALDVRVTVSGRIQGRAAGGMADTIRRRLVAPDLHLDDALEPAIHRARRARLRHQVRRLFTGEARAMARLPAELGCTPAALAVALAQGSFGLAWGQVERDAAKLARVAVPVAALAHETASAEVILSRLRRGGMHAARLRSNPAFVSQVMQSAEKSHRVG